MSKVTFEEMQTANNRGSISDAADKLGITPEKILGELANIAFVDPSQFFKIDKDGNKKFKSLKSMRESVKVIKKIKGSLKSADVDFETYSKMDALKELSNMLGLQKPIQVSLEGKINLSKLSDEQLQDIIQGKIPGK
jgi:hypothetical protein